MIFIEHKHSTVTGAFWHFLSAEDYKNTDFHNNGIKKPISNNQINQA